MTLALAILLFGFPPPWLAPNWYYAQSQSAEQTPAAAQPANPSAQEQQTPPAQHGTANNPGGASDQKNPAPKHTRSKRTTRKKSPQKKASTSGCDNASTVSPAQSGNSGTSPANPKDPSAAQNAAPSASHNCPEKVVVVRHGGTAEPSIQLAGGDQESQKRNDANQMLGSTEANLEKISSIPLSPEQQDTVSQIKQFVDQSKAALAAGDLERGHTLAWKAQLLSQDLVKPEK